MADSFSGGNFSVNGLFGKVRMGDARSITPFADTFDTVTNCGWHDVNHMYLISREEYELSEDLLLFTVQGTGALVVENSRHILQPGSVAIIPRNAQCCYYVPPQSEHWEFWWLHINGQNCGRILQYMIREYGNVFYVTAMDELALNMDILVSTKYKYQQYEFFAANMVSKLLFIMLNSVVKQSRKRYGSTALAMQVIEYIEKHATEQITVREMAQVSNLTEEHLIRVFKAETGLTPMQYVTRFRLARACNLLRYTSDPIADIAHSVGYNSLSSFNTQFKREFNLTPREYRTRALSHV